MSDSVELRVNGGVKGFAEDKDEARALRRNYIMPALRARKKVILNFSRVTSSTQSFVHALIGEPLQKIGEPVLNQIEFRSCGPQIKSLVELVVDYSLSGFGATPSAVQVETGPSKRSVEKPVERPDNHQRSRTKLKKKRKTAK